MRLCILRNSANKSFGQSIDALTAKELLFLIMEAVVMVVVNSPDPTRQPMAI
jgi:hypothetical protein